MNFRTGMTLGAYSDVSVIKVDIDADATRATKVYANAKVNSGEDESDSLLEQDVELSDEQRRLEEKRKEQDASRKQEEEQQRQLLNEIQKVMVSGEPNSKVPNGCPIVVNGKDTVSYMNFCIGVRLDSYSDINVTNVECNATIVTKIYVNAKVKSVED